MAVGIGGRVAVEAESPECKKEGENQLAVPAQVQWCSGVSRSLAVSTIDWDVMGGHHRLRRRSGCGHTSTKTQNDPFALKSPKH